MKNACFASVSHWSEHEKVASLQNYPTLIQGLIKEEQSLTWPSKMNNSLLIEI